MQLITILVQSVLAGSALAAPSHSQPIIGKRDLATIQTAIGNVQTALGGLDTAVKALTTDPSTAAPLLTASTNVQNTIQAATTNITATQALSLTDALSLQQTATGLTTSVNTTISDLVAKKAILDQLGVSAIALQSLQQQKTASTALGQAIVSKVPAIGQNIATQSIGQVNAALDSGIAAFSSAGGATTAAGTGTGAGAGAGAVAVPAPAGTGTGTETETGTTGTTGTGAAAGGVTDLLGGLLGGAGGGATGATGAGGIDGILAGLGVGV